MANEIGIQLPTAPTGTPYALIRNSINQVWDDAGNALVAYVTANLGLYDLPMSEQGVASKYFTVSFPVNANLIPGVYTVQVFDQLGGAPVETDTFLGVLDDFTWDGGFEVNPNLVHADIDYNVDNANALDEYKVQFLLNGFEVTAAQITGTPTINVKDDADVDLIPTVNMTQVTTTARWLYDAAGAERATPGETFFVDVIAIVFGVSRTYRVMILRDK